MNLYTTDEPDAVEIHDLIEIGMLKILELDYEAGRRVSPALAIGWIRRIVDAALGGDV